VRVFDEIIVSAFGVPDLVVVVVVCCVCASLCVCQLPRDGQRTSLGQLKGSSVSSVLEIKCTKGGGFRCFNTFILESSMNYCNIIASFKVVNAG